MWRWLEIANLSLSEMPIRFGTVDWVRLDQGKFLKLARLLRRGRFKPCRQCDQIVQFMKSIDNNFSFKSSPNNLPLLVLFGKHHF